MPLPWFGFQVPEGITAIQIMYESHEDMRYVLWKCGDGVVHKMPFEQTDEGVHAVLAAMKLTC
jgi:hypothetical protein